MKNFLHLLLLFVWSSLHAIDSNAATYYWVGGSGNWSEYATHWATTSGGSTFHAGIPTINDDVVIDANSFTAPGQVLNLDSTFYYCNSMTWAGVQFNPTLEGNGATLNLRGNIQFDPAMTLSNTNLELSATSGSYTIHMAGQRAYSIVINANASYTLGSTLGATGGIDLRDGSLNANGFDIDCGGFNAAIGTTLLLGDITLTVNGQPSDIFTRYLTLDVIPAGADQTTVFFNCVSGEMDCINNTTLFDTIRFANAGTMRACQANYCSTTNTTYLLNTVLGTGVFPDNVLLENCTVNNLQGKEVLLIPGSTTNVSTLTLNTSCSDMGRLSTQYVGAVPATLNVTSGTINIDYAILEGITATGGATFNATDVIDLGGNTGWNITPLASRNLYWVGGTGDWNDPNHWSLSSGGPSAGCTPNRIDNAFFDANSLGAGDSVRIPALDQYAGDLIVSGVSGSPTFFGDRLVLYGSLDLQSTLNWRLYQTLLYSDRTGSILRTSGNPFMYLIFGDSCWYTLQDSLHAEWIYQQNGNVDYNGQRIDTRLLSGYPSAQAVVTNSLFYLKDMYFDGTFTGSASCDILFDKGPAYCRNNRPSVFRSMHFTVRGYLADSVTVNTLIADESIDLGNANDIRYGEFHKDVMVSGSNRMDTLTLSNGGYSYIQAPGETLTLGNDLQVVADCNGLTGIRSEVSGSPTNISMASGNVQVDYVSLQSVSASGGATFTANNSVDGGNNSGWTINSPAARTVYWVGGSGNWSDPTHWALSSGGTSGACVPSAIDQVVFDANSGLANGTLTLDVSNVSAASLDFSAAGNDIRVDGTVISVAGDLSLAPQMNWNVPSLSLLPNAGNLLLTSNGTELDSVTINGSGTVSLQDACAAIQLQLINGDLDAAGHDLSVSRFTSATGTNVNLGAMTLTVSQFQLLGGLTNSRQADVLMRWIAPVNGSLGYDFRTTGAFRHITILDPGARFFLNSISCERFTAYEYVNLYSQTANDTIRKAIFFNDCAFSGNIFCDTLFLNNPGKTSNLGGNITFSELVCNGTPAFPVFLKGNPLATLTKTSGQVCIGNALIQNVTVTGGATFNAGVGCSDLGGNSGWTFAPCTVVSNVWPGDANYDLVCDNSDILDIGVAFGQSGPVRAGASLTWSAQPATDFNGWFVSAVNFKHADCDGDGSVGFADTLAVNQNYGQTHPARVQPTPTYIDAALPPLVIDATPDTVAPGATVNVAIQLGTLAQTVDSLYGIAFTVYYDPTVVDTNSLVTDFSTSWLGTAGVDLITFFRHTPSAGRIDFALVRNDGQNVFGGFGDLALFDVVIVDNISTLTDALFTPGNLRAITAAQFPLLFGSQNDRVVLDPTLTRVPVPDLSTRFLVFPNPAAHTLTVRSQDVSVQEVSLYDLGGRCVFLDLSGQAETRIAVDALALGVYQLRVVTDAGVFNKKIEVLRR